MSLILGKYDGNRSVVRGNHLNVRIGVFFDGTSNNKYNVKEHDKSLFGWTLLDVLRLRTHSYTATESNVARMFELYVTGNKPENIIMALYIDGIATAPRDNSYDMGGFDSLFSAATGMGKLGINGTIDRCCRKVANALRGIAYKYSRGNEIVFDKVTFDVFGFSRGAAAARRFCSCLESESGIKERNFNVSLMNCLKREKFSVSKVQSDFLGLFDTVSSYGLFPSSFLDNVKKLSLDVRFPLKVVHFVAADEHRELFALTRIKSARSGSVELIMPGSHSDIGGSYPNFMEQGYANCGKTDTELIEEGWKRNNERRIVRNEYSLLVMSLMIKYANSFRSNTFSSITPNTDSLPNVLRMFKNYLYSLETRPLYVFRNNSIGRNIVEKNNDVNNSLNDILLDLRYGFLHFSASSKIGMHPVKDGKRIIIDDCK